MPLIQYLQERIRLGLDTEKPNVAALDDITNESPSMWRGNNVQFELGFLYNSGLISVANIATVTLTIKGVDDRNGPVLAQKSTNALNLALTVDDYNAGRSQHCIIEFSNLDMRLDLKGENSRDFFVVVRATTNDLVPKTITFGFTVLTMFEDGSGDGSISPVLGATLVPLGAVYNGSGNYTLPVTQGKTLRWVKSTNDLTLINGSQTFGASSEFTALGSTVTLTGTPSRVITAGVLYPSYMTSDQVEARLAGLAQLVNRPGAQVCLVSPNGKKMRILGVGDGGEPIDQTIDIN